MGAWQDRLFLPETQKIWVARPTLARPDGGGGVETTTLYLSDSEIHPARKDRDYLPRNKTVPYIKQKIQEATFGKSQITYGNLEILAGAKDFDYYLSLFSGWHWAGQPVVVLLGFDGLDVGDYEPVFTGRMGYPSWTDRVITIPIQDYQIDLFNTNATAQDYSGQLPTIITTLLTAAGISNIDSTAWSAWAAENNFSVWYRAAANTPISTVLDALLGPLCCFYTFDRTGAFVIGTLKPPDASTAELTLADDWELMQFKGSVWSRHYWRVVVEYLTATGDSPTYGSVSTQDATIKSLNPSAEENTVQTALTSQTAAQTVRDRRWALWSTKRHVYPVEASLEPLSVSLHDQVDFSRNRWGISGNHRIIGFDCQFGRNRVGMDLLQ